MRGSTQMVYTGSGGALYWATAVVEVDGVLGVYLVDTGSRALVTRHKVGVDRGVFPQSILYGSGRVWGYRSFADVSLAEGVTLPRTDVLQQASTNMHGSVDGVLGLLPGGQTNKRGLRSVELDFSSQQLLWNSPPAHPQSVCVNPAVHQHKDLRDRLWLRGALRLHGAHGACLVLPDVHVMLDTGATKCATFFRAGFVELKECTRHSRLEMLEVRTNGTTLRMPLPRGSRWPACLPERPHKIAFVIVGLQALASLKSVRYELSEDGQTISRLCVAQW